jgi:uncharacterized UPF0160 family protein
VFDRSDVEDIFYVVHPSPGGTFMVFQMPVEKGSFEGKMPLPAGWAGLRDQSIAAQSGVADAVFVHVGRFCGGAKSMSGAIQMAKTAIKLNS